MSTEINLGGGGGGVGIQGIQGIQGVQGLDGAFAAQGIQGLQGTQGLQGIEGTQGATGIQGSVGNTGSQGIQGITGIQGIDGSQGATGIQGSTGSTGSTGAQGIQGVQGLEGTQGATGVGIQGTQGIQGTTGATGNTGAQGTTGLQGVQGTDGLQGATGTQGSVGAQGIQGIQGTDGTQGATGLGSTGYYVMAINNAASIVASAPNTLTIIEFLLISSNNGFTLVNNGGINDRLRPSVTGIYKVSYQCYFTNTSGSSTASASFYAVNNITGVTESVTTQEYMIGQSGMLEGSFIVNLSSSAGINFFFQVTDVALIMDRVTAPSGSGTYQPFQVNIVNVPFVGIQGSTGTQGATGVGTQGIQGIQGTQGLVGAGGATGLQGLQGTQGIQGAGGTTGYYGSFYSTQDQNALAINTLTVATFNNTSLSNGISVVSNSRVTFANTGRYALNFSIQLDKISSGGGDNFFVWLRKNGADVADSTTKYVVQSNYRFVVSSLDFLLDLNAGDFIEIAWSVSNTDIILEYDAGVSPYPAVPSIILNAFQVTYAIQGTQGTTGTSGSTGTQGIQGIQGIQGLDGTQGTTGNTGSQGIQGTTGIQGVQGTTGATGNTGSQGIQGITGIQGNTGIQGTQGLQGIQGVGNVGSQGIQGITGAQGIQGIQGLQGDPGVVGYFYSAYDVTGQTAAAINTETDISFANTYGSNSVSISGGNLFRINEAAVYKVQLEVQWRNTDTVNTASGIIYVSINGTAQVGTTVRTRVQPSGWENATLEFSQSFNAGDTIQFKFQVDDTDLSLGTIAAGSPAPSGASAFANIAQIARTLGPLDGNIQLSWTSGYVNLTNGVDNTIALNNSVFNVGAALTSSNLGTANAAVQFLYTGVYIVNLRAHFFDLGTNMILTSNLYTSTNGTTWSFSTIIGRMRYEGTNTNQVQNSSFLVRVTSLPFYIQPRINPSANAPFPADLGAPTAFSVTRVGDL